MYILQKFYSTILNPVYSVTGKIDERIRNFIITICCIFLSAFFIAYYDKYVRFGLYLNHTHNNIMCGAVLVILVIFSIKEPLKKVKWDPFLFYSFFIAGAGIVAVSFLHPVGSGYRSFGLMMMFGFPCLYYVWNNRGDYDTLYVRLAGAAMFAGLEIAVHTVRLAFEGRLHDTMGRVDALFFNANMYSMIGMAMVCSAIYLFAAKRKSVLWFLFCAISFASGWEIILLGVSRLSILVGLGSIFAMFIYSIKIYKTTFFAEDRRISFIKAGVLAIITVLVISFGSMLMDINSAAVYKKASEKSAKDITADTDADTPAADNEEPVNQTDVPDEVAENDTESASDRFSTEGKDLNTYTAGRVDLWRAYAQHLNMWGNDISQTDYQELTGTTVQHAHNNFLEYAYRCGIPVACIHIILELYAGIVCICFLFRKKYTQPFYLFAVIFMICYAVESMFDIATLPFERHAPFYFYMALIPVFGRLQDNERAEVANAGKHAAKEV